LTTSAASVHSEEESEELPSQNGSESGDVAISEEAELVSQHSSESEEVSDIVDQHEEEEVAEAAEAEQEEEESHSNSDTFSADVLFHAADAASSAAGLLGLSEGIAASGVVSRGASEMSAGEHEFADCASIAAKI
jgi:archaellum component FlaD/FlaE